jgi:hypothetical protein
VSYATIKGMSWYQSSNRYCVKDIMSLRPRNNGPMISTPNHKSSAPPSDLQAAHIASRREAAVTEVVAAAIHNENMSLDSSNGGRPLTMDDLNPVEQAAATLGVNPVAVKPISWLNEKHFNALVSSNALTPDLTRRIAAYKALSEASTNTDVSNYNKHPHLMTPSH